MRLYVSSLNSRGVYKVHMRLHNRLFVYIVSISSMMKNGGFHVFIIARGEVYQIVWVIIGFIACIWSSTWINLSRHTKTVCIVENELPCKLFMLQISTGLQLSQIVLNRQKGCTKSRQLQSHFSKSATGWGGHIPHQTPPWRRFTRRDGCFATIWLVGN